MVGTAKHLGSVHVLQPSQQSGYADVGMSSYRNAGSNYLRPSARLPEFPSATERTARLGEDGTSYRPGTIAAKVGTSNGYLQPSNSRSQSTPRPSSSTRIASAAASSTATQAPMATHLGTKPAGTMRKEQYIASILDSLKTPSITSGRGSPIANKVVQRVNRFDTRHGACMDNSSSDATARLNKRTSLDMSGPGAAPASPSAHLLSSGDSYRIPSATPRKPSTLNASIRSTSSTYSNSSVTSILAHQSGLQTMPPAGVLSQEPHIPIQTPDRLGSSLPPMPSMGYGSTDRHYSSAAINLEQRLSNSGYSGLATQASGLYDRSANNSYGSTSERTSSFVPASSALVAPPNLVAISVQRQGQEMAAVPNSPTQAYLSSRLGSMNNTIPNPSPAQLVSSAAPSPTAAMAAASTTPFAPTPSNLGHGSATASYGHTLDTSHQQQAYEPRYQGTTSVLAQASATSISSAAYSSGGSGSSISSLASTTTSNAYANSPVHAQSSQHHSISSNTTQQHHQDRDVYPQSSVVASAKHYRHPPFPSLHSCLRDSNTGVGSVGLQNLGNTCFMNSILQSLNAVPELMAWFLKERAWGSKAFVAPAYADLVSNMWTSGYSSVVSPSNFLRKISKHDNRWGDGSQQDSQEFLHSLLEALQAECNRIVGKPQYRQLEGKGTEEQQAEEADVYARSWNDSMVDDIFGGQLQSTIQCQVCGRQSHCFDPFLDLAVPIPSKSSVAVQDCLQAFVEVEKLDGGEAYKCEHCKKCQPHTKKLQIYRFPRVLVLTLKRFSSKSHSASIFSRFRSASKNNTSVSLEVDNLDLSPYCNQVGLRNQVSAIKGLQPTYQLISISHHSGSLEGGHYTATARNANDGSWYNFNDSSVRRDSKPGGPSSSAYVLFYRLVNPPSAL